MTELVHRTPNGRTWHWPRHTRRLGLVAACSAIPVSAEHTTSPGGALIEDQCSRHGCRERWDDWVRRAIVAAQADEIERLRGAA